MPYDPERRQRFKRMVFDHYGWKCACCGETMVECLSIDHIKQDGAKHREEIGSKLYYWLVKEGFPEGFQTLCRNCNYGRYINNGVCPHKQAE